MSGTATDLTVNGTSVTIKDNDEPKIILDIKPFLETDPDKLPEDAGATRVTVTAGTTGGVFELDRQIHVTVGKDDDTADVRHGLRHAVTRVPRQDQGAGDGRRDDLHVDADGRQPDRDRRDAHAGRQRRGAGGHLGDDHDQGQRHERDFPAAGNCRRFPWT